MNVSISITDFVNKSWGRFENLQKASVQEIKVLKVISVADIYLLPWTCHHDLDRPLLEIVNSFILKADRRTQVQAIQAVSKCMTGIDIEFPDTYIDKYLRLARERSCLNGR